jgi:hypothetical protein
MTEVRKRIWRSQGSADDGSADGEVAAAGLAAAGSPLATPLLPLAV